MRPIVVQEDLGQAVCSFSNDVEHDTSEPVVWDLVVIGGGSAGLSASLYAVRAGLRTITVESDTVGGQLAGTELVDNYPGIPAISGQELGERMWAHAKSLGATFLSDRAVTIARNDDDTFKVLLSKGHTLVSRTLILASGATPRKAGFIGEDTFLSRGVSYCALCDAMFYDGKRVFVVGGGMTAIEEAMLLARFARKVTLIVRGNSLRARGIILKELKSRQTIDIRFATKIVGVHGKTQITSIDFVNTLTNTTYTETFEEGSVGIFVFVGHDPASSLVADFIPPEPDGSVWADATMATRIPGLYVAGDVRSGSLRQIVTAVSDGAIAATSAAHYVEHLGL